MARSIEDYERRRRCWLRGCSEPRVGGPFCEHHWTELPEDLQYRIEDAYQGEDTMDWLAAISAAMDYLNKDS